MLTSEMRKALERTELLPFATASKSGVPNVVPIKYFRVVGDDTLWIADNYLLKTLSNLRENAKAAFYVWSAEPKLCIQAKGDVALQNSGTDYEAMRNWVFASKPDAPAKRLVVFRIREIYQCLPGIDVGQLLWPS